MGQGYGVTLPYQELFAVHRMGVAEAGGFPMLLNDMRFHIQARGVAAPSSFCRCAT